MSVLNGFRFIHHNISLINVREYRRGNHKWTIRRNWQHWVHKTQDADKQSKLHYYVLDTTMHNQTHIK